MIDLALRLNRISCNVYIRGVSRCPEPNRHVSISG